MYGVLGANRTGDLLVVNSAYIYNVMFGNFSAKPFYGKSLMAFKDNHEQRK